LGGKRSGIGFHVGGLYVCFQEGEQGNVIANSQLFEVQTESRRAELNVIHIPLSVMFVRRSEWSKICSKMEVRACFTNPAKIMTRIIKK
jgi:hypothetical protein